MRVIAGAESARSCVLLFMRHSILMVLSAVALVACGGGSEGGSPSDDLFSAFSAVSSGGFRGVVARGPELPQTSGQVCGFNQAISRADAAFEVRSSGGQVTLEDPDRWCASLPGQGPLCLVGLDDQTFVVHERTNRSLRSDVTLTIGLNEGRRVVFDTFVSLAGSPSSIAFDSDVMALSPASDIVEGEACDEGAAPSRTASDINGMWLGKRAVYDTLNDTGYTEPHEMSCSSQHCNIQTQVFIDLGFVTFDELGVWRADLSGASATAVMSPDGQAMAMWICAEEGAFPVTSLFGAECQVYGFNRLIPG